LSTRLADPRLSILFTTPWDERYGGVTHVVASLAESLEERGHSVTFLFPSETRFSIRLGKSQRGFSSIYCRLRGFPARDASWRARLGWYSTVWTTLPQLVRHLRKLAINVVNVHYPAESTSLMVDVARKLGAPLVVSAHGSDLLHDLGPLRGPGLLRLLDHADSVVVPSMTFQARVAEEYEQVRGKIQHIYNGYDEREIATAAKQACEQQRSTPTAICIAALKPKKGIDVLLRAMSQVRTQDLHVKVIGDGPLRSELESQRDAMGLAHRVSFVGPKERTAVFAELAACDFLVMPSRHDSESFGLACLEAMAFAKPVVASAIGGLRELVDDGETGFSVPPDDPKALARAMDALASNEELRVRLGEGGQRKARRFTTKETADAYELLFRRLVSQRTTPSK
jgi:glycosyltransferase involved in cell wall biosynthesis